MKIHTIIEAVLFPILAPFAFIGYMHDKWVNKKLAEDANMLPEAQSTLLGNRRIVKRNIHNTYVLIFKITVGLFVLVGILVYVYGGV